MRQNIHSLTTLTLTQFLLCTDVPEGLWPLYLFRKRDSRCLYCLQETFLSLFHYLFNAFLIVYLENFTFEL